LVFVAAVLRGLVDNYGRTAQVSLRGRQIEIAYVIAGCVGERADTSRCTQ
jgi:hypothetical protein